MQCIQARYLCDISIDPDRMAAALGQLAETYEFQNAPDASMYYTDAYLPGSDALMLK